MSAQILDFQKPFRERIVTRLVGEIGGAYGRADEITTELVELLSMEPERVVDELPKFLDRVRAEANPGRRAAEVYTSGPNPDWTGRILSVAGSIYPEISSEIRTSLLNRTLGFLDMQRYDISQENVALIDEPWLVRDILANRNIYNPGFKGYIDLLEGKNSLRELEENPLATRNGHFLARAVAYTQTTRPRLRREFYEAHPALMRRTVDAIAATAEFNALYYQSKGEKTFDAAVTDFLAKFDPALHEAIRTSQVKREWIELSDGDMTKLRQSITS